MRCNETIRNGQEPLLARLICMGLCLTYGWRDVSRAGLAQSYFLVCSFDQLRELLANQQPGVSDALFSFSSYV
jgi:hypothetical protein